MIYRGSMNVEAEPSWKIRYDSRRPVVGKDDEIPSVLADLPREDGYSVTLPDGDRVWIKRETFHEYFQPLITTMNFGQAIAAARDGKRIARRGWNGKRQYVELATCISYRNREGEIVNVDHAAIGNAALAFVGTSGVQLGWLASQADMLADDWYIVDELTGSAGKEARHDT